MERLNPKTDLVFKLLLQQDADFRLLRSMLECVLKPASPIKTLEILNPNFEPDYPGDKPIALDVRAYLDNLVRIDIEMQAQVVTTDEEFETLAKEDSDMAHAKEKLEEISSDPDLRARAYERETALRSHYHTLISEREESEARGRVEGHREMLIRLLSKRFGSLPDWASERLTHADGSQLDSYAEALLSASTLEEALQQNS